MTINNGNKFKFKRIIRKRRENIGTVYGKKHGRWKGNNVDIITMHVWLSSWYNKLNICQNIYCETKDIKRTEFAKLKGKKYIKDINNYVELCTSCHRKYDFTRKRIIALRKSMLNKERPEFYRPIAQFDINNNIINKFISIKDASIKTGVIRTGIINCLSGTSKTSGGFIWRYIK